MKKGDKKEPRYVAKYDPKLDVFKVEDTKTGKIIDTYTRSCGEPDPKSYWLWFIPLMAIMVIAMIINGILIS